MAPLIWIVVRSQMIAISSMDRMAWTNGVTAALSDEATELQTGRLQAMSIGRQS